MNRMRTIGSRKICETSDSDACRLKLGDHIHFDAYAKRQLCHTEGAARMHASLAESLDKEFRCPIRDFVRFREVWRPVDHD
jgi:hypothetical protein